MMTSDNRAERARHQYNDKLQKLERELESSERDKSKLSDELREKDSTKEKLKDDYERKIRNYESQVLNYYCL